MEPFATLQDLEGFLGRTIDPARGDLFLELATNTVRGFLRQHVYRATTTDELIPRGGRRLLLPELPVWEVTEVVETIGDAQTTLTAGTDYRLDGGPGGRYAVLVRLGGRVWPDASIYHAGASSVAVTYDHGYDVPGESAGAEHPIPDVFRNVTMAVAGRVIGNPLGHRQETIGRYSYTAGGASGELGVTLTLADQMTLEGYLPGTVAGARA